MLANNTDGTLPVKETNTMLKKIILALVTGGLVLGAAACNTVKGVGRDIESVGQAGDDAL